MSSGGGVHRDETRRRMSVASVGSARSMASTPGVLYHALSDARSAAAIQRFLGDLFFAHNS
jgi:hypothetical protein